MVALLSLLAFAAIYVVVLGVRYSRRQARAHKKFLILANLLEKSYGGHAEEIPEAGEAGSGTPRRDGERR
ncbi:hypothetical protein ACFRNJ_12130 [Streptomyces sp. NPDC056721]|uniref:hypothetical protein n=1 Tax=Streptomyces sp. NPDC056721 TaxID=3345923 RepID=UPI0036AEA2AB